MRQFSLSDVIASRACFNFLAAVLAFGAVLGLGAITGWHAAVFHDDMAVVQIDGGRHVQGAPDRTDPDAAVHLAAHAVGTAVNLPPQIAAEIVRMAVVRQWVATAAVVMPGLSPSSLLRPPRG